MYLFKEGEVISLWRATRRNVVRGTTSGAHGVDQLRCPDADCGKMASVWPESSP